MPGCTSRLLPKALSHANRRLPSQQLTAMCLLKMTRERISGWLSVMLKVSCAGDAGTQLNTQLASEGLLRQ